MEHLIKLITLFSFALLLSCNSSSRTNWEERKTRNNIRSVMTAMQYHIEIRDINGESGHALYCSEVTGEQLLDDVNRSESAISKDSFVDGWGNYFKIDFNDKTYNMTLKSSGADGIFDTNDDIVLSRAVERDSQ